MLAHSLRRTLIPCVYLRTRRAAIGAHTSCIWRTGIKHASHASHASHAIAQAVPGGDPFSSWIAVNPLPGIDAAPQQVHQAESSAQDSPRLVTRRYHHTIASAVVHTLSQRYSRIQWSPDRKAFLFSAIPTASAAQGRASADASNVLPPQAQPSVSLKLPIVLQKHHSLSGTDGTELLQRVAAGTARPGRTLIALLTADSAALALWEDGELLRHKVLTGYTIRKQQGGSQLKHLRSGAGKQSAGGALRSRETRRFFLSVADRLQEWEDDIQACELLIYSGGPRAWNEVFNTNKSVCPLTRDDHRWLKAPISVRRPRFDDVERVLSTVSHGEIAWQPDTGVPDAAEPVPHKQD